MGHGKVVSFSGKAPAVTRILAISGSLRRASVNSAVIQAAAQLASNGIEVAIYDGLAELPPFNPDLEFGGRLPAVDAFRSQLDDCDALLISSPEYAHGVPGALKNALDWVVGSGELIEKPIGLINASPRSLYAHAQLAETLTTMSATIVPEASITIAPTGGANAASAILADRSLTEALRCALGALARAATPS
jgi:chromate reductase